MIDESGAPPQTTLTGLRPLRIPFNTRRAGFTLVEILLSALLAAAVAAITLQTTRQVLNFSARMTNLTLAQERGQAVLSILEPRVLHAGFGLTWTRGGTELKRSFGGGADGYPSMELWNSLGPLYVLKSTLAPAPETGAPGKPLKRKGPVLAVLYAVPSGCAAKLDGNVPVQLEAGASATVTLLPPENASAAGEILTVADKSDLRSWVTFPMAEHPVHAILGYGGRLTAEMAEGSGISAPLRPYDEMHYIRANRFQVPSSGQFLQSEEMHKAWSDLEARVDGVLATWFEWTPSKSVLDAWVLTSGGRASSRTARPADWPADADWRDEFSRHELAVVRASWLVPGITPWPD